MDTTNPPQRTALAEANDIALIISRYSPDGWRRGASYPFRGSEATAIHGSRSHGGVSVHYRAERKGVHVITSVVRTRVKSGRQHEPLHEPMLKAVHGSFAGAVAWAEGLPFPT